MMQPRIEQSISGIDAGGKKGPRRVLIIKPSSMGDIILGLPAAAAIRRGLPGAGIAWMVRTELAPLLENHPHIDEVVLFDRKYLGRAWRDPAAFGALVSLVRDLRSKHFDIVLDLQGLFRTAALGYLSGCKRRLGMSRARELGHLFYTDRVPQNTSCVHLVDYYLRIVSAAGIPVGRPGFVLPVAPAARSAAETLLGEHGIEGRLAVLMPGSARASKCWPPERFAQLAGRIKSDWGLAVAAVGAAGERPVIERIKAAAEVPVANLAGLTDIKTLIALLDKAALVVSNDTGPGHIAAALGRPLVMIFGPSNPARVAPYGRPECVAAVDPDRGSLKADSYDPRHDIRGVTFDMVYEKVRGQLS